MCAARIRIYKLKYIHAHSSQRIFFRIIHFLLVYSMQRRHIRTCNYKNDLFMQMHRVTQLYLHVYTKSFGRHSKNIAFKWICAARICFCWIVYITSSTDREREGALDLKATIHVFCCIFEYLNYFK